MVVLKLKKLRKTENIVLSASLRDNTQQWKFTVLILRTRGLAEVRGQPRPEVCHLGAGAGPGGGGGLRDEETGSRYDDHGSPSQDVSRATSRLLGPQ